MRSVEDEAARALYHRERARAEREAASRARDDRARRAHLALAMQHEIAMFRSHAPQPDDGDAHPHGIGATLRAVIALPDATTGPSLRLDPPPD